MPIGSVTICRCAGLRRQARNRRVARALVLFTQLATLADSELDIGWAAGRSSHTYVSLRSSESLAVLAGCQPFHRCPYTCVATVGHARFGDNSELFYHCCQHPL